MSDTDFRPGDKVRVTYEAEYHIPGKQGEHFVTAAQYVLAPSDAIVELIERADLSDSAEPQSAATDSEKLERIRELVNDYRGSETRPRADHFVGWIRDALDGQFPRAVDDPSKDPVGTVAPNTPAAEKQAADELSRRQSASTARRGVLEQGDEERKDWSAHVKKVLDRDGDMLTRDNGGWSGNGGDAYDPDCMEWWDHASREYRPYAEVRDQ